MKKVNYKLIFEKAKILAWSYLIAVLLLKLIGVDVLTQDINSSVFRVIDDSLILRNLVRITVGVLGCFLMLGSIMSIRDTLKSLIVLIPYFFVSNIFMEFEVKSFVTMVLSFAIYFLPLAFNYNAKMSLSIMAVDVAFQTISFLSRGLNIGVAHQDSVVVSLFFMLDYYILWLLYFISKKGGVLKCHFGALDCSSSQRKRLNLPLSLTTYRNSFTKLLTLLKLSISRKRLRISMKNLRCWIKFVLPRQLKTKVIPFVVFLVVYGGVALLVGKILESLFLLIAYGSFRYMFPKQFHADYIPGIKSRWIDFTCVSLSSLTLITALHNTPIMEVSILASIVVAFIIDWVFYVIKDWLDFKLRYEEDFTKYGLSREMSDFAYDWKVKGLKDKELMSKYEILSTNTLNSRKRRIKQAMHTK